MITTIKGTTSAGVQNAISEIRHNLGAGSGMVFTLLVMASAQDVDEVMDACLEAGREHPSRIILATDGSSRSDRMDAEIQIGEDIPGEVITLKFHGEVAQHKASALLPLLLRLGAPLLQPLRMAFGTRLLQHLLQLRFIDSGFGHLMHIHCFGFRLRL